MKNICDFVSNATLREREELERALLRNEDIFWAVKPIPRCLGPDSLPLLVFAVIWLSFITFFTFAALGMPLGAEDLGKIKGDQIPMLLFTIPFWLVGLALVSSPLWRKRKLRQTLYVLTNRRALAVEPGLFSWTTRVYALEEDLIISRNVRRGGEGDLIFEINYNNNPPTKSGFMSLPDVSLAEDKVNEALAARKAASEE